MKALKFLFIFSVVVCVTSISCNTDPCKETFCLNGGDCFEGDCQCPSGYTGVNCEIELNNGASGGGSNPDPNCDTCTWALDGECDNGLPGSVTALCPVGTDCTDCANIGGGGSSGYSCINSVCTSVSTGAQYSTLTLCQGSCQSGGGNSSGYSCINSVCTSVNSGAQYSNLTLCQSNCNVNTSGYNCNNGNCNFVNSGAQFSSLALCENNCALPQLMVWNSNPTPCPAGAGNTISVYIDNGYVGGLNQYADSAPNCGASGAITREVSVGIHTVRAECGSTTWPSTQVNVTSLGCWKFELK